MVRYNLLVISDSSQFSRKVMKAVGKSFRKHLLFEAESLHEAHKLMDRLHVDMIVCDLDFHRVKLDQLCERFPNLDVIGVCSNLAQLDIATGNALVLKRDTFPAELALELKEIKKGQRPEPVTAKKSGWFAAPASFDNYASLVGA